VTSIGSGHHPVFDTHSTVTEQPAKLMNWNEFCLAKLWMVREMTAGGNNIANTKDAM
jgi:hypothetical protein